MDEKELEGLLKKVKGKDLNAEAKKRGIKTHHGIAETLLDTGQHRVDLSSQIL